MNSLEVTRTQGRGDTATRRALELPSPRRRVSASDFKQKVRLMEQVPVVLRFRDGRTERHSLAPEFDVERQTVRVVNEDQSTTDIPFQELKAVFFPRNAWPTEPEPEMKGSVLAVEFADGEIIRGTAPEYSPQRNGFYLYPLDRSKNEKVFVVNSAIVSIDVEKL